MNTKTITDPDGDQITFIQHREGRIIVIDGDDCGDVLVSIDPREIRAALDEVAPEDTMDGLAARVRRLGERIVKDIEYDMEGGVTAAAIEQEANGVPFSEHLGKLSIASHQAQQAEKDAAHFRTLAKKAEDRAEKAESKLGEALHHACPDPDQHDDRYVSPGAVKRVQEIQACLEEAERDRDEWKESAIRAMADVERAEQPRPLTADDITDEMVERARRAYDGGQDHIGILVAALKEPLARPEGAEELEIVIGLNAGDWTEGPESVRALADLLASHGVRVTGGES